MASEGDRRYNQQRRINLNQARINVAQERFNAAQQRINVAQDQINVRTSQAITISAITFAFIFMFLASKDGDEWETFVFKTLFVIFLNFAVFHGFLFTETGRKVYDFLMSKIFTRK